MQPSFSEPDFVGDEPVAVLAVEVLDARKVLVHGSAVVTAVQEILSVAKIFIDKLLNQFTNCNRYYAMYLLWCLAKATEFCVDRSSLWHWQSSRVVPVVVWLSHKRVIKYSSSQKQ